MSGTKINPKEFGFYHSLIHRVFLPMKLGRMNMTLPDGQVVHYGNGNEVEANIRVLNYNFFKKCVYFGDVGFGESYVDGDWQTDDINKVIEWMILNVEDHPTLMADAPKNKPVNFLKILNNIYHCFRPNTLLGSMENITAHYDLGNDFYKIFLDQTMTYSSAYFKNNQENLKDAQIQKYDALCRKLRLKPSDHLLEIGTGWGGFASYAAKNYGCHITSITISPSQYEYARKLVQQEKLSDKIEIQLKDYRLMQGSFDKIVSIEMIEAVGDQFLKTYFKQCHSLLKKSGILALQMILSPDHRYDSFRKNTDWIQKHIFPGSLLPSMTAIQKAINSTGTMTLFDYEDMTLSYVKTLDIWKDNFNRNINQVKSLGFDEAFTRKWNYYLSYCSAAFKMRNISVVQAIYTRPNNLQLEYEI